MSRTEPRAESWSKRRRIGVIVLVVVGVTAFSAAMRHLMDGKVGALTGPRPTVLRIAHSFNDPQVADGFSRLATEYSRLHPEVEIKVQAIPLRVYRQWIRTQLIGEDPPDLIEPLGVGGVWEEIASQYLQPLTANVLEANPYNRGTELADISWKDTYFDGMEGGYFLHLMEFYAVPFSLNNRRIFYNKKMFRAVKGDDRPPRNFREWIELGARIKAWSAERGAAVSPLAIARDDLTLAAGKEAGLFTRYCRSLTGNMMAQYDMQAWGAPDSTLLFWGLMNGTIDLKQPRFEAAFGAVKALAEICQTGFSSDLPENKRFLFLQQKVAMVLGDSRDFSIYKGTAGFEVGVFDFPQVARDDPELGRYFTGPFWEGDGDTGLMLAVTRDSVHQARALDFLRFATSSRQNEEFCTRLSWFPAIRGARVTGDLEIFTPHTLGTLNSPDLAYPNSSTEVYFKQNLPLYLGGQLSFAGFMDGLATEWREHGWQDINRMLDLRIRGHSKTEFNVTTSKARLLFGSAGDPAQEIIRGDRTRYQLGQEIVELLDSNILRRKYIHRYLPQGKYTFPPPVADLERKETGRD